MDVYWLECGLESYNTTRFGEAIVFIKKSLTLFLQNGDEEHIAICYNILGRCYFNLEMYLEALDNYELSLRMFLMTDNQDHVPYTCAWLAACFQELHMYFHAIKIYQKGLACITSYNQPDKQQPKGYLYCGLGHSLMYIDRYQDSKMYIEKVLIIAEHIGDRTLELRCYTCLSDLSIRKCRYHQAVNYGKRALGISKEIEEIEEKHPLYYTIGRALFNVKNFKKALGYFESSVMHANRFGNRKIKGKALYYVSLCYLERNEYDMAIRYGEESIAMTRQTADTKIECCALQAITNAHRGQGRLKEAIDYYTKSLQVAVKFGHKESEKAVSISLGNVYNALGKLDMASKYLQTCLNSEISLGEATGSGAYSAVGNLNYSVGKYKEACRYHEQYLNMIEQEGDISSLANAYRDLAIVYIKLDNVELSRECTWKMIIIDIRAGQREGEVLFLQKLGTCFRKDHQSYKAISIHKKALRKGLMSNNCPQLI